jgi:hypothetical protein
MRRLCTIICQFIVGIYVCQNGITGNPDWFVKTSFNSGFILEQHANIGLLVKGYPSMYQIDFGKPSLGNKLWHLENNKPDLGLTFTVIDFKNPSQLGYAYAVAPYIEIPLNEKTKATRLIMRLCWGVTYISKSFDISSNRKNIVIGSHINSFVQFKWFWHIKLSKNLRFEPGFAFSHASNAKAKVPNLGLNLISLNAGLHYTIPSAKKNPVEKIDSSSKVKSKNEILIYSAFGFNQKEVATSTLYSGLLSFAYHRNIRNTHKFGAGLDVFLDQNFLADQVVSLNQSAKGIDNFRMAIKACYSYNIGRISFPFETGVYVFQKIDPDGFLMSRIGVRYYGKKGFFAGIGLRTHFAVAYDFEYGLGYRMFLK